MDTKVIREMAERNDSVEQIRDRIMSGVDLKPDIKNFVIVDVSFFKFFTADFRMPGLSIPLIENSLHQVTMLNWVMVHPEPFALKFSHFTTKTDPYLWVVSKFHKFFIQLCSSARYCDQAVKIKKTSKIGKIGHFLAIFWGFLKLFQFQLPGRS